VPARGDGELESRIGGVPCHDGARLDQLAARKGRRCHAADDGGQIAERVRRELVGQINRRDAEVVRRALGAGDDIVRHDHELRRRPGLGTSRRDESTECRDRHEQTADDRSAATVGVRSVGARPTAEARLRQSPASPPVPLKAVLGLARIGDHPPVVGLARF
jgi:hypothetical protein